MEQHENTEIPSYWTSVSIAALVIGILSFIISVIGGYMTINADPTGAYITSQSVMGIVSCLVGAFGGMIAIWHYNRETGVRLKLGKGALIGLFTGLVMAFFVTLIGQIWSMIDPTFNEQLMNAMIANYEAMEGMDDEMRQSLIDSTYTEFQGANTLWGIVKAFLFTGVGYGILNTLSGLLGVALFARKKEDV